MSKRITGVELQDNWRLPYALTHIKGIGWPTARGIVDSLKMDRALRVKDLESDDVQKLVKALEEYTTEGDLIREVRSNIQRLKTIGTYRGIRHNRGLPGRGQRTKSNARTNRGKRKTVGSFKKDVLTKMQQDSAKS